MSGSKCGTLAGYVQHGRDGTERCAECRRANTEYHRAHRATHPERVVNESRLNAARSRALTRLAALHPGQFQILLDEEMGR